MCLVYLYWYMWSHLKRWRKPELFDSSLRRNWNWKKGQVMWEFTSILLWLRARQLYSSQSVSIFEQREKLHYKFLPEYLYPINKFWWDWQVMMMMMAGRKHKIRSLYYIAHFYTVALLLFPQLFLNFSSTFLMHISFPQNRVTQSIQIPWKPCSFYNFDEMETHYCIPFITFSCHYYLLRFLRYIIRKVFTSALFPKSIMRFWNKYRNEILWWWWWYDMPQGI